MIGFSLTAWVMVRLPFAAAGSLAFAVFGPSTTGTDQAPQYWFDLVKPFGVAAPFALLCLFGLREFWKENKRLLNLLLAAAPALADVNKVVAENTETLNRVAGMLHEQTNTRLDPGEISTVRRLLEDWARERDRR
jgi:hypothetical protein